MALMGIECGWVEPSTSSPIVNVPAGMRAMPAGTVDTGGTADIWKLAVTDLALVIATEQLPLPEQAPVQPVNWEPLAAVATSVTTVPELNVAVQVLPQLIPAGELETVPEPLPVLETLKE